MADSLRSAEAAKQIEIRQQEWASKKWVWVIDAKEGCLAAYIVKEAGDQVTVKFNSGEVMLMLLWCTRVLCVVMPLCSGGRANKRTDEEINNRLTPLTGAHGHQGRRGAAEPTQVRQKRGHGHTAAAERVGRAEQLA